ncbi:hypothetical protein ACFL02_09540 [Planctomycetota bacterium]
MTSKFVPKIGEKVTIGQPADDVMNKSFTGQTGIVGRRTLHFPDLSPEEDLWTVKFPSGKSDAFFTEEMIRVDRHTP